MAETAVGATKMRVVGFRPRIRSVAFGTRQGVVRARRQVAVTASAVGEAGMIHLHVLPDPADVTVGALSLKMLVRRVSRMTASTVRNAGMVEFDRGQPPH